MKFLLFLTKGIDAVVISIGKLVTWVTLLVVLISAGNAIIRKLFDSSSNAWLEVQWYLFGVIFLLAAGYTFLKNEHVRVDIINQRLSERTQIIIDIVGVVFFMLPACLLIVYLSIPFFELAFSTNEQSGNAGGLVRWPVKLLIPVGFTLLSLSGFSHVIKCIAFLRGEGPNPLKHTGISTEEALAQDIATHSHHTS